MTSHDDIAMAEGREDWSCQACGACCAYSAEWPRFSLESEVALALIPAGFVDDAAGRMRCEGDRCTALLGEVGQATACAVYAVRPDVCRTCEPGDPECRMARARHGL
ncbi:YkgJ family cysteine cluster protein [Rhodoplanes sp.]|uniref:YkgJ family cysteine cluster protein n=1 Tax=Rhodoplanes sp. TaxID=1968906 RepID=UPI0025E821CF|nr:YkgJ family cysteine cluster protein [Rhodoplanes sp.]